jgi:D-alanyl-lipoteichoic acid acyltransferase DltB (MBOAT superfamily)
MKKQEYMWVATEKWIYLVASLVTFAICGIWHGEGWNFLVWGLLFGVFLTYSNWTEKLQKQFRKKLHIKKTNWLYLFYKTILTFFLVSFTWIFFRAGSLDNAIAILENMLTSHGSLYIPDAQQLVYCVFGILFLVFVEIVQEFKSKNNLPYISGHWYLEQIAYAVLIIIILTIGVFDGGQFIYFQF